MATDDTQETGRPIHRAMPARGLRLYVRHVLSKPRAIHLALTGTGIA